MARRSLIPVSCCIAVIALICCAGTPFTLRAATDEEARGNHRDIASSVLVKALARQIGFVKSFSVGYPYQFRQTGPLRKSRTAVVNDTPTQRNEDR